MRIGEDEPPAAKKAARPRRRKPAEGGSV